MPTGDGNKKAKVTKDVALSNFMHLFGPHPTTGIVVPRDVDAPQPEDPLENDGHKEIK